MPSLLTDKKKYTTSRGAFYPLGATIVEKGVNFAIYSRYATGIDLLLFDKSDGKPQAIIPLENRTKFIWHVLVENIGAGQLYGYKVKGPYLPGKGLRFNENKLLIDPYAKALTSKVKNSDNLLLGYDSQSPDKDLSFDDRDSSRIMPKCIVIDDSFDWKGDKPPETPIEKTIIYETHVKGFTAHSSSKVKKPGTYLGFIEKIPYLKELGITAVELLPVQEYYVDDFLTGRGLTNYWGYNTVAFFAPELSYSTMSSPGCQVAEFKTLVRELHKAGIEVIIDVVYNHTGEGNEFGPTISFKGVDNLSYYALSGDEEYDARYYMNWTGCGNSIDTTNPMVVKLIADSLRYWVEVMHVDGFRFDLATVLGRRGQEFSARSSFFDVISQDPVLGRVKLIAEPWDMGTYQVGNFPIEWCEWNGKFRDTVRRFVKGDQGQTGELASRFSGSSDLFSDDGRTPYSSINFITCHDGFTLNDLVSYNEKHNDANLDNNTDGTNDNNSWNCGIEGETDDKETLELRYRLAKNHMCLLLLSFGTPMLLGGDEFLRTQKGNNNAYCQDNDITWFDWSLADKNKNFLQFTKNLITILKKFEALQLAKYVREQPSTDFEILEIDWTNKELESLDWESSEERTIALNLHAKEKGGKEYYFYIAFNGNWERQEMKLPMLPPPFKWIRRIDTSLPPGEDLDLSSHPKLKSPDRYLMEGRSTIVLVGLS